MLSAITKTQSFFFSTIKNPYVQLGVDRSASQQDIKQAYYKLAKVYHPDITPINSEKFKDISQAYNILKDPSKRKEFDRKFDNQHLNAHQHFSQFYKKSKQGPRHQYPIYDINLTRKFNKNFIRNRMFMNSWRTRDFNYQRRKQIKYFQYTVIGLLQIVGLIYGIQILKQFSKAAEKQRQEQFRYYYYEDEDDDQ